MTNGERRWLLVGIVVGVILAVSIIVINERRRRPQPAAAAQSAALDASDFTAAAPAEADAYSQFTEAEQKAIGVETAEVKRQTIRKEILAPGRVAEAETSIGTISARIGGRINKL